MRPIRFALLSLMPALGYAQTTPVTATNVTLGGQPVNGYLYLTPVGGGGTYDGSAVSYSTSGNVLGSTTSQQTFAGVLTGGALASPLVVPDQCTSSAMLPNTNIDYLVQVVNTYPYATYSFRIPASTCYISGSTPMPIEGFRAAQTLAMTAPGLSVATSMPNGGHCRQPADLTIFTGTTPTNYKCGFDNMFHQVAGGGGSGTGTPGSNFLQSNGAPSNSTGNNGDSNLDVTTGNVYLKSAGSWGLTGNLKGAQGTPGTNGTNGTNGTPGPPGAAGQGFNYRGAWAASTAYKPYDVVTYSGSTYESSNTFTSGATFNASNWNLFAAQGQQGNPGTGGTSTPPTTALFANFPTTNLQDGQQVYQSDWANYTGAGTGPCLTGTGTARSDGAVRLCKYNATAGKWQTADAVKAEANTPFGITGLDGGGTTPSIANPAIPANNINVTAPPYFASPYGATTTTTSASVASGATAVPVTSASTFVVGNGVLVTGGGSTGWTGSDFIGTVTAVSGNTLTVTPPLSASVSSGAVVKHDDSAALNAISTFCTTSDCGVYFPPIPGTAAGLYRLNGPVLDPSHSNAIVVLPNAALANGTGTAFRMYGSTRPVSGANATGILTDYNLSTAANLFGVYVGGSVIPGFSNTYFSMGNLRLIDNTTNPNLTLLDCTFCKGFTLDGSTWFMSNSPGANTSGAGFGFKQPSISNDVDVSVGTATVVGFANLMRLGEHSVNLSLHGANTANGYVFDSVTGNQGFNGHENTVTVANLWSQSSNSCISGGTSKQVIQVQSADCETNVTYVCNDPNNYLYGDFHFQVPYTSLNPRSTDSHLTAAPSMNGCNNLRVWNMHTGVCYGSTCPPVATPNTATLANGMIERWKMQDGSGTSNANSVDSSNPLTATNVTYASATGYTGATATFNGTSSYSRAGNQTVGQFTGASPFTACIWHSPSSVAAGDHWVMGTLNASSSLVGWGIEDGYNSGNNLFYLAISSSNYIAVNFASGMTANNRYLVCASYDGSKTAAGVSLYVNNVAVSSSIVKDTFGSGTITPAGAFTIGARADSTAAGFWGGSLADAILWNRQLTTSELSALYNAGPGGF